MRRAQPAGSGRRGPSAGSACSSRASTGRSRPSARPHRARRAARVEPCTWAWRRWNRAGLNTGWRVHSLDIADHVVQAVRIGIIQACDRRCWRSRRRQCCARETGPATIGRPGACGARRCLRGGLQLALRWAMRGLSISRRPRRPRRPHAPRDAGRGLRWRNPAPPDCASSRPRHELPPVHVRSQGFGIASRLEHGAAGDHLRDPIGARANAPLCQRAITRRGDEFGELRVGDFGLVHPETFHRRRGRRTFLGNAASAPKRKLPPCTHTMPGCAVFVYRGPALPGGQRGLQRRVRPPRQPRGARPPPPQAPRARRRSATSSKPRQKTTPLRCA